MNNKRSNSVTGMIKSIVSSFTLAFILFLGILFIPIAGMGKISIHTQAEYDAVSTVSGCFANVAVVGIPIGFIFMKVRFPRSYLMAYLLPSALLIYIYLLYLNAAFWMPMEYYDAKNCIDPNAHDGDTDIILGGFPFGLIDTVLVFGIYVLGRCLVNMVVRHRASKQIGGF